MSLADRIARHDALLESLNRPTITLRPEWYFGPRPMGPLDTVLSLVLVVAQPVALIALALAVIGLATALVSALG